MTMLERKDVPLDQTWNKEGVYPTWDHWQVEFEEAKVGASPSTFNFELATASLRSRV